MSYFTVPPCAPGAFQHQRRAGSCLEGSPGATAGPRAGLRLQALGWCCRAPPCPCQGLRMPAWDSGCPSGRCQGAPWGRVAPAAVTPSSAPAGAASARSASQGEALAVQPMRGARGSSMSICVCGGGGVSPQQGGPCNHPPGLQTLSLKAMLVAEAFDSPPTGFQSAHGVSLPLSRLCVSTRGCASPRSSLRHPLPRRGTGGLHPAPQSGNTVGCQDVGGGCPASRGSRRHPSRASCRSPSGDWGIGLALAWGEGMEQRMGPGGAPGWAGGCGTSAGGALDLLEVGTGWVPAMGHCGRVPRGSLPGGTAAVGWPPWPSTQDTQRKPQGSAPWHGRAQAHTAPQGRAWHGSDAQRGAVLQNLAQRGLALHGTAQLGTAQPGQPAWPSSARHSLALRGTVRHGTARGPQLGMALRGPARRILALRGFGTGWHGLARAGTAQISPAAPSMVR